MEFWSVDQAADYFRIHRRTFYKLVTKGQIPVRKLGGRWKIVPEEIKNWFKNHEAPPVKHKPRDMSVYMADLCATIPDE